MKVSEPYDGKKITRSGREQVLTISGDGPIVMHLNFPTLEQAKTERAALLGEEGGSSIPSQAQDWMLAQVMERHFSASVRVTPINRHMIIEADDPAAVYVIDREGELVAIYRGEVTAC